MPHCYDYPRPSVTVDTLVFSLNEKKGLDILLIKRAKAPFQDHWAIPGGFVDMDEDLLTAAKRELEEETGMIFTELYELGAFDKPDRDPRGRVISFAFWGIADKHKFHLTAADDAADYCWLALEEAKNLAFDHDLIIEKAKKEIVKKLFLPDFVKDKFPSLNEAEHVLSSLGIDELTTPNPIYTYLKNSILGKNEKQILNTETINLILT